MWCLKALHPSDPLVEVTGIPDQDAAPTAFLNYQSTFTVTAPTPDQTWKFDACLLPNPVSLMYVRKARSDDFGSSATNFLNTQLPGNTTFEKYANFRTLFERWRLAYMSVTVYQDAPALANQGTIVVSQVPIKPRKCSPVGNNVPYLDVNNVALMLIPHIEAYSETDYPNYERSQAMPNSYFARSDNGAYVPLKLTNTCQKWHSEEDSVIYAQNDLETTAVVPADLLALGQLLGAIAIPGYPNLAAMPPIGPFPVPLIHSTGRVASITSAGRTPTAMLIGEAAPAMCNDIWAHISARNLSPQTSYSFFVRAGYEVQVSPSSSMSPQLKLSPPYDALALQHYFAIARELKDGYPADYNDLGKLWTVIKEAASSVAPLLKMVPGLGNVISAVENPLKMGITALEKALKPTTSRDTPPAASVQKAREVLRTKPVVASRPKKKKKKTGAKARRK